MTNKLILVFTFFALLLMYSFKADKKKKVIFFGDSITQAGVEPKGYISILKDILAKQGINGYELAGAGIGGNKVYDLYLRLEDDVISQSPDIVVIWVGVNDVWHKRSFGTGTDADKFEKFYRAIIKKIEAAHAKVVLVTPATIGEKNDYSNELDGDLNKYSSIIRSIAADKQLPLIDLRRIFTDYEKANNPSNADRGILTADGVHLNDKGNQFVAEQVWTVLKDVK